MSISATLVRQRLDFIATQHRELAELKKLPREECVGPPSSRNWDDYWGLIVEPAVGVRQLPEMPDRP